MKLPRDEDKVEVRHEDGIGGILLKELKYWDPINKKERDMYLVHCNEAPRDDECGLMVWMDHEVTGVKLVADLMHKYRYRMGLDEKEASEELAYFMNDYLKLKG